MLFVPVVSRATLAKAAPNLLRWKAALEGPAGLAPTSIAINRNMSMRTTGRVCSRRIMV